MLSNPLESFVSTMPVPVVVPAAKRELPNSAAQPALHRDCVKIWDVPFDRMTMQQGIDRIDELVRRREPSYVITANLNYCMLHAQDPVVRQTTRSASLILADGQPIVWRSKLKENPLPERVAGSEMILHLAERCAVRGYRIYLLGGAEGVAQVAAARLQSAYPGLQIAGVESPPFRPLNDREQAQQDARIRSSNADVLLVAFGQPKGELWIHRNYQRLGVPVSIQLGASFDFLAGTATRAPEMYQRVGMEWAYRMATDPKRLVPRYAANTAFLASVLWNDWKRKVTAWGLGEWVPAQESQQAAR